MFNHEDDNFIFDYMNPFTEDSEFESEDDELEDCPDELEHTSKMENEE